MTHVEIELHYIVSIRRVEYKNHFLFKMLLKPTLQGLVGSDMLPVVKMPLKTEIYHFEMMDLQNNHSCKPIWASRLPIMTVCRFPVSLRQSKIHLRLAAPERILDGSVLVLRRRLLNKVALRNRWRLTFGFVLRHRWRLMELTTLRNCWRLTFGCAQLFRLRLILCLRDCSFWRQILAY